MSATNTDRTNVPALVRPVARLAGVSARTRWTYHADLTRDVNGRWAVTVTNETVGSVVDRQTFDSVIEASVWSRSMLADMLGLKHVVRVRLSSSAS